MLTFLRFLASHFAVAPSKGPAWPLLLAVLSLFSSCTRPAYYALPEASALVCAQPTTSASALPGLISLTPPIDSLPATSKAVVARPPIQAVKKPPGRVAKQPPVKRLLGQHLLRKSANFRRVALRQQQPTAGVAHPAGLKGQGLFFLVGGLAVLLIGIFASADPVGALLGLSFILLGAILLVAGLIMLLTALANGL